MSIMNFAEPPEREASAALYSVYLALGSNMGDRHGNLVMAVQQLNDSVTIHAISSVYETEPVGYTDQPRFLNIVCSGRTGLSAQNLLYRAKAIEGVLGRRATFRNGPRSIDVDILLYDDLQIVQEDLLIPHPRMAERAFVLAPLAELAPTKLIPGKSKTVQETLTEHFTGRRCPVWSTEKREMTSGLPP